MKYSAISSHLLYEKRKRIRKLRDLLLGDLLDLSYAKPKLMKGQEASSSTCHVWTWKHQTKEEIGWNFLPTRSVEKDVLNKNDLIVNQGHPS